MKPTTLRLLVGVLTFTVGWCCTNFTVNIARPTSAPSDIKALPLPQTTSVEIPEIEEQNILETVFRYQMQHCYKDEQPLAFFFSYQQRDLPIDFLSKFNSEGILIKNRSERRRFFLDSGQPGILVGISSMKWKGLSTVDVSCSCRRWLLDGYSYTIRLVREQNGWKVTRRKLVGVS